MGYFPVRYDSRVVIYEHKIFTRLATGHFVNLLLGCIFGLHFCWYFVSCTSGALLGYTSGLHLAADLGPVQ